MSESSELQSAVEILTRTIDKLRDELVRKDVYIEAQKLITTRIDHVDDDVRALALKMEKADERRAADRRLILTALVLPVLLIIIQLYLAAQTGTGGVQ